MNFQHMTIKQVQQWMDEAEREQIHRWLHTLSQDERAGIRRLVHSWYTREKRYQKQVQQWQQMTQIEKDLHGKGYALIAGVDEVGRGPVAGPLVTAAVVLPEDFVQYDIDDSKKLSIQKRQYLADVIKAEAIDYTVRFVSVEDIEKWNIYQATKKAMRLSIADLSPPADYALIDAIKLSLPIPSQSLIKGDARSISIAAASILAKVARDQYMREVAETYPQYGFERHVGYATKEHLQAIEKYGLTPLHRQSFLQRHQ